MPEKFAELQREYEAWNAKMLPLNPNAASSGISGRTMADHYGLE